MWMKVRRILVSGNVSLCCNSDHLTTDRLQDQAANLCRVLASNSGVVQVSQPYNLRLLTFVQLSTAVLIVVYFFGKTLVSLVRLVM
jgi:hypothetical protein